MKTLKGFLNKILDRSKEIIRALPKPTIKAVKPPEAVTNLADLDKKLVFSLAKKRFPSWQQLQYLPQYLSGKERIAIRILSALIIVALGYLVVNFYLRHVVYLPREGGNYSEALVGQPAYINPILSQNDVDRDLGNLIYSGLFRYNQKLELVPDLATGYELSEDKLTYTIHLRENVLWHNGNTFMADDVIFTYETIQDERFSSPFASSFQGIAIDRIDDYTVTFTLPKPFSPFISNLVVGILPAHIWSDVAPGNFRLAEYNIKPIGTGPFIFKELLKDRSGNIKSYTLTRNESYYSQAAYLDKIIFKFYPDFETALEALQSSKVDGISYVPKDLKSQLDKSKNVKDYPVNLPQYTAVFFNQKNGIFKNNNVNKALLLGADRQRIIEEALGGQGIITNAPILEGFIGYHAGVQTYGYDPRRAAEVLDEQGWKIPEGGGLRQKDGAELKFSLTTVDQPEYLKTADILRENWEALGIGIELKIMNPLRVDKEVILPRAYEAFLYGEILGADPDPYPFWHSTQSLSGGLNLSNYYNKAVDKLLEEARQIDNTDERTAKYVEFQNILAADAPAIFLYSPWYDYAMIKKIKGFATERITVPSDRFNGIEEWYLKTRLGWK